MKIDSVELRVLKMRLLQPFRTSFGVQQDRYPLLVRLEIDGRSHWGECVAGEGPWYSYETVETAWQMLKGYLLPAVIGRDLTDVDALESSFAPVRGHRMAKASVEMAFTAALAERARKPLSRFLGGVRDRVETGVSIGIQPNVDQLLDAIGAHLSQGYRRIKVKIEPGWDVMAIGAVRERYPEITLMADANSAYSLDDAAHLAQLDRFGLLMLEQPLAPGDLVDHAALQRQIRTPICLDESIESAREARQALQLGACQVINIKPGRVGGFAESRRIHDIAANAGVPVWCGGMLETGIGRACNVALATLPNFRLPGDISASDRYWAEDIVEPAFKLQKGGTIAVPTRWGIGVRVKVDLVDRLTVRRETIRA
ncbi:MAG TPA: o-succinylbenzoate synthase [Candidatus Dormibacteraeota bacterium]|nr:o-succinylbenzoate synthase [Candidatus Dormibacteraeota bacterium]